jgi:hypothetical protein
LTWELEKKKEKKQHFGTATIGAAHLLMQPTQPTPQRKTHNEHDHSSYLPVDMHPYCSRPPMLSFLHLQDAEEHST